METAVFHIILPGYLPYRVQDYTSTQLDLVSLKQICPAHFNINLHPSVTSASSSSLASNFSKVRPNVPEFYLAHLSLSVQISHMSGENILYKINCISPS